jgi:hypothetical protein
MSEERPLIRLRLERDDLPQGEIALTDLAKIADATQRFVRQIAGNVVGQRGPGAQRKGVADASSLRLVGLKPGSTILEIAGAEPAQDALEYDIPTDLTELTFDLLVGGLSAVASSDPRPELPVGYDTRLVNDLDDWLRSMRGYKSVAIESQVAGTARSVRTTPRQARNRLHDLSPQPVLPFVSPTEQALEGKLYALNLNTGSFYIEDDAGHRIRTVLPVDLRDDAATFVSRRVHAVGKPEFEESGRLKLFNVSELGPAPDFAGLAEQRGFFEAHALVATPPAGDAGSLDDWAIAGLSDEEAEDFMDAISSLR